MLISSSQLFTLPEGNWFAVCINQRRYDNKVICIFVGLGCVAVLKSGIICVWMPVVKPMSVKDGFEELIKGSSQGPMWMA